MSVLAGIPKFYRWLSERYPLVNQPIAGTSVPIIDNLYFDMNGIIHNCTHGNDPSRKLTEVEMTLKTFDYLDKLVHIIQPQQLLYMAVDGGVLLAVLLADPPGICLQLGQLQACFAPIPKAEPKESEPSIATGRCRQAFALMHKDWCGMLL